jgi:hypothetical protein
MLARCWVQWLQQISVSVSLRERRRSKEQRCRGRSPLVVEPLEDRVLLSLTFTDKLVPVGESGGRAGQSVAQAGDVAVLGAPNDNGDIGAAYVFMLVNGTWTQQTKLVPEAGGSQQGSSVALSSDGTTLAIGAPGDNGALGAVDVFTLNNGTWTQQDHLAHISHWGYCAGLSPVA